MNEVIPSVPFQDLEQWWATKIRNRSKFVGRPSKHGDYTTWVCSKCHSLHDVLQVDITEYPFLIRCTWGQDTPLLEGIPGTPEKPVCSEALVVHANGIEYEIELNQYI